MRSLWNEDEATLFPGELGQRVYSSRLLGREASLVLHGGGNTSVKLIEPNLFGEPEEILYVKGSGWDLENIEAGGFSPLRLHPVRRLAQLERLSDPEMVNALRTQLTRAAAPTPSVEAIVHALLPYKYVDHTHADAVLAITNTPQGLERIREIYGEGVVVVPYVMPGFALARRVADLFPRQAHPGTLGMILVNHGVFTFGATARESYERMIALVTLAEDYLKSRGAWDQAPSTLPRISVDTVGLAALRSEVSRTAGRPMILACDRNPGVRSFVAQPDAATVSQRGPATPDHSIRTKRLPMWGRDVRAFAEEYRNYFEAHRARSPVPLTMLDPAPRVILDPELGMVTVGGSAKEAQIVADIYRHTIDIIERAEKLERWQALPAEDIFDVEYWDLEQAKLRAAGKPPVFAGEVALVTGAARGIGRACVESLLVRGAAVVGLDLDAQIETLHRRPDFLGLKCDVTDAAALNSALEKAVERFGGMDMLVLNAGVFPTGRRIEELDDKHWREVMRVNLDANLALLRIAHPLLKSAPRGGRVVVIGSKNVPAPGPGVAAYSASKAALNQLMRVAALEWGADGIRVNALHPNMVFDTGIWSEEVLAARAASYGLSVEQYRKNNILRTEVTSRDVGELAAELLGPLFAKTTGAQIPVDGGNERVV